MPGKIRVGIFDYIVLLWAAITDKNLKGEIFYQITQVGVGIHNN